MGGRGTFQPRAPGPAALSLDLEREGDEGGQGVSSGADTTVFFLFFFFKKYVFS